MGKIKTHFEQVPLDQVQKLLEAEEFQAGRKKPGVASNVSVEMPAAKTEPFSVRRSI